MKAIFQFVFVGCVLYCVSWFITFQTNPYTNCIDHPNKKMRSHYYYCEPFGFELKKGFLDKTVPTPWMKDKKSIEYLKAQKERDSKDLENIEPSTLSD